MFPSSTEDLFFPDLMEYEHLSSEKYLFSATAMETVTS